MLGSSQTQPVNISAKLLINAVAIEVIQKFLAEMANQYGSNSIIRRFKFFHRKPLPL